MTLKGNMSENSVVGRIDHSLKQVIIRLISKLIKITFDIKHHKCLNPKTMKVRLCNGASLLRFTNLICAFKFNYYSFSQKCHLNTYFI